MNASTARVDTKLEIVVIPFSDVDRAKEFHGRLDSNYNDGVDFRVLQFTTPGSGCSVVFGRNVTAAAPGSAQGLYLVVSDIDAARKELVARRVNVSEVFHFKVLGAPLQPEGSITCFADLRRITPVIAPTPCSAKSAETVFVSGSNLANALCRPACRLDSNGTGLRDVAGVRGIHCQYT